jgi:prepilin-type N-terminal cleavage/methylation domain-containing protein
MSLNNKIKQQGFTIVELLIVIVVIGILAAITIVAYNGVQNRAKTSSAQSLANAIVKKAEAYNTLKSNYPAAIANFADYPESKLDNASAVTTALPTDESTVSYKTCTSPAGSAQVTWYHKTANKVIAIGLGGGTSTPSDGSGTTATLCT